MFPPEKTPRILFVKEGLLLLLILPDVVVVDMEKDEIEEAGDCVVGALVKLVVSDVVLIEEEAAE